MPAQRAALGLGGRRSSPATAAAGCTFSCSRSEPGELWGGPPGPRPAPWPAWCVSHGLDLKEERVQGDPRGPGGPPHRFPQDVYWNCRNTPVQDSIRIRGSRVHNLKNISLDIPHNRMSVVTGVSGSGKSSLAFDTIYAEGQRRYVESLSAYARQFLERM